MSKLSEKDMKEIIARRDKRFDGRFYFGVKTTGIYCRPICPARPKLENILIFKSSSEAEKQGYRPCLRCRPDLAPAHKLLDGTMNTVSRALRIIHNTSGDELKVTSLAESMGMTDRHLRRLFDEHLGASPIEIMITQRLHFAKQALQETYLPISEIALASGFQSIRRFNEAFKERFQASPSEVRGSKSIQNRIAMKNQNAITLRIPIHAPYDWLAVIAYLARHAAYGIELVEGSTYRRFVPINSSFGSFVVSQETKQTFLTVQFYDIPLSEVRSVLTRIKTLFDTDHNPVDLSASKKLKPAGVRVPASFDPFEIAVSIILSQLVSTQNARTQLKKLIEMFGTQIGSFEGQPVFEFPSPAKIATAPLEKIGLTKTKAGAIRDLATMLAAGTFNFQNHIDFETATKTLLEIRGIGPWTAAMIAMRCLGNPDAFPKTDLIIERALTSGLVVESDWSSSRAYLVHCLWRDYGDQLSKAKGIKK